MYNSLFCRLYNEFGWNEYPRVFAEELLEWLRLNGADVRAALDLGCGTGVLCEALRDHGIDTLGIDLSDEMIAIAQRRAPELCYRVADMVSFKSARRFDLVTCTGDALNHVTDAHAIDKVFHNVWEALNPGGLFIFDLLKADEVPEGAPFEASFSDNLTVRFCASRDSAGFTTLQIDGFEGELPRFHEVIREKLYAVSDICAMLSAAGFSVLQCADQLLIGRETHATTWFIVAKKAAAPER